MNAGGTGFEWERLLYALPNVFCVVMFLNGVSYSLRSLTFGPLVMEARSRAARRHYPLSDLLALMMMLQLAAGGSLAFSRRPGFHLRTLEWNPPLDGVTTAAVIIVMVGVILWWWWDGAWLLNAARVSSGWQRFVFLVLWTPLGYLSHWMIFFGGCGVLSTLASRRSGVRWTEDTLRISPVFYVGISSFLLFACGLFGAILARWAANRLADVAFDTRIRNFRSELGLPDCPDQLLDDHQPRVSISAEPDAEPGTEPDTEEEAEEEVEKSELEATPTAAEPADSKTDANSNTDKAVPSSSSESSTKQAGDAQPPPTNASEE